MKLLTVIVILVGGALIYVTAASAVRLGAPADLTFFAAGSVLGGAAAMVFSE